MARAASTRRSSEAQSSQSSRLSGTARCLARAGTILGPHEDVGRLPCWLARMAAGGGILAPGPPGLELQLIDARDRARFVLDAVLARHGGAFNVVSRRGQATMRSLLEACHSVAAPRSCRAWGVCDDGCYEP